MQKTLSNNIAYNPCSSTSIAMILADKTFYLNSLTLIIDFKSQTVLFEESSLLNLSSGVVT